MSEFASPSFRERLAAAANAHAGFVEEARWFDGSILLDFGGARCWMKIYRGRVIEALDEVPPFGFTFALIGSPEAWEALVSGRRLFADLITPGRRDFRGDPSLSTADRSAPAAIRIEGNAIEASRLHEALFHLADSIRASAA